MSSLEKCSACGQLTFFRLDTPFRTFLGLCGACYGKGMRRKEWEMTEKGKECKLLQLPGPALPGWDEINRLLHAIQEANSALQSWQSHLTRVLRDEYNPEEKFEGFDWGLFRALIHLSRLVEHAQKLFALDMKTLRSPYMPRKVKGEK